MAVNVEYKCADFLFAFILNFIHFTASESIRSCNESLLKPCPGENEVCYLKTHTCECFQNYTRVGDHCEDASHGTHSSNAGMVALISITTIALLTTAVILAVKKYNLIEFVRNKINLRRNNNVTYEDVMIGQDDPPINL